MRTPWRVLLLGLLLATTLTARQAAAQTPPAEPVAQPVAEPDQDPVDDDAPARKAPLAIRARVFGLVGFQSFTAADSFSAVLDTSSGLTPGGGAGVLLGRNLFVDVSVSRFSADGSRVFVTDGGEVISLGIPTQVVVTPIDVSIGWRFAGTPRIDARGRPVWRPVPYAGGGFGFQRYQETAEASSPGDDVSETQGSYHVLGGIELPFGRHLAATADVLYRWVPDGLGDDGVSAYYDETDLGGAQVRFRVVFTF